MLLKQHQTENIAAILRQIKKLRKKGRLEKWILSDERQINIFLHEKIAHTLGGAIFPVGSERSVLEND